VTTPRGIVGRAVLEILLASVATHWGVNERLGPVTLAHREDMFLPGSDGYIGSQVYGEANLVDARFQRILQEAHPY
jgi:hypothetical protein